MTTHTACGSYFRELSQFACLVKGCRRYCQLRVDELSRLSSVTVRRLRKYEAGFAPPHWADVLVLAQVFGIRVSTIIAALKKPVVQLSIDECKCLLDYAQALRAEQRNELLEDLKRDRRIHLEDASSDSIHDVSIADWPAFLLPSLEGALVAEGSRLHAVFRVLDVLLECDDDLAPLQEVTGMQAIDAGTLLVHVHGVMSGIHTRLNGLRVRHTDTAPSAYIEVIERQRSYILEAIELIAACGSNDAFALNRVRNTIRTECSVHLPGAVNRALAASFGLIETAKSMRRSNGQPVLRLDVMSENSVEPAMEKVAQKYDY